MMLFMYGCLLVLCLSVLWIALHQDGHYWKNHKLEDLWRKFLKIIILLSAIGFIYGLVRCLA